MSDYERPIVLKRCCYTSTQHLRRRDFRDVVERVHCRTGHELGVAGLGLELGARLALCRTDHRWVLFLPGMVGLWIWESSYPAMIRLLAFGGIVGGDTSWSEDFIAPCRQEKKAHDSDAS